MCSQGSAVLQLSPSLLNFPWVRPAPFPFCPAQDGLVSSGGGSLGGIYCYPGLLPTGPLLIPHHEHTNFYLSERLPACPDTVETSLSPPGHNVSGHVHGLRVPSHQAFEACLDQFGLYLQISWGLWLNLMDLMAATHETSPRTPAEPGSVPAEVLPVEGLVQPRAGPDLPSVSL